MRQAFYQWQDECLILFCHIQANAKKDQWLGPHGDRLKIKVNAAPTDNKANKQLIKFVAKQFSVALSAVVVSSGEHSKLKTLRINQPKTLPTELNIKQH